MVRWDSLRVLHQFRITQLAAGDPLHGSNWPIARDYWTQDVVDNLNRLAEQAVAGE